VRGHQLSGKPFRTSSKAWQAWWQDEGEAFEPIALEELAELRLAEERRRLSQTTRANSFFGIRVISHRVIFVLDIVILTALSVLVRRTMATQAPSP